MYKLRKPIKETVEIGTSAFSHRIPWNKQSISLHDLDNRIAWGRGGGTDWNNTHFYHLLFGIFAYNHAWYNTERWCADLYITFNLEKNGILKGTEEWEEDFDQAKLISIIEDIFQVYVNNILALLNKNSIKINKQKTKFWSDHKFVFEFGGMEEDLETTDRQHAKFKIIQALYWETPKGLVYYKDHDKTIGKIPKDFDVITKEELTKLIRRPFVDIANRFLCQNFNSSPKTPDISEIMKMSKPELEAVLLTFKNNITFKDIIK